MEFEPDLLLVRPAPRSGGGREPPQPERYVLVDVCAAPHAEPLAACEVVHVAPGRIATVATTVAPSCRGLGLGWRLIAGVADRMRERGARQLTGVDEDGAPFELDL